MKMTERTEEELYEYKKIKDYFDYGIDKHTPNWRLEEINNRIELWCDVVCTNENTKVPDEVISNVMKYQEQVESWIKVNLEEEKTSIQIQMTLDIIESHFLPRDLSDDRFKRGLIFMIASLLERRTPEGNKCTYELYTEKSTLQLDEFMAELRARIKGEPDDRTKTNKKDILN